MISNGTKNDEMDVCRQGKYDVWDVIQYSIKWLRRRSSESNICVSTGAKVKSQNNWNWMIKLK